MCGPDESSTVDISIANRLMDNPVFAGVYEHAWRPVFTRMFSHGSTATVDYDNALRAYLQRPGERRVLDIACGPGNYTRSIADGLTGDGRAVGIDYAPAMIRAAARTNRVPRATYLRGDGHTLPFADNSFHEVICLAALYLIPDPLPVLDEMVRVCRPGGQIVVFTSVRGPLASLPGVSRVAAFGGYRVFGPNEITGRLRAAGAVAIEQSIIGEGQYVLARTPEHQNSR